MFFAYIIKSKKDGRIYKGITFDLNRRLKEHNSGRNKSTSPYRPWLLAYYERLNTREEARKRELFFKSGEGREFLKDLLDP